MKDLFYLLAMRKLKYNLPMYNSKSETDAVLLDFKGDINQVMLN
jgi:hypothetical protein